MVVALQQSFFPPFSQNVRVQKRDRRGEPPRGCEITVECGAAEVGFALRGSAGGMIIRAF